MSNPFSRDFAAPSRAAWCKATRWWLKRNVGLGTQDLVAITGLQRGTLQQLCTRHQNAEWFCELLGALVTGWRPSTDWAKATPQARLAVFDRTYSAPGGEDVVFRLMTLPPRWRDAILNWKAEDLPPRCALIGEAFLDGAVPCGLPFGGWTP